MLRRPFLRRRKKEEWQIVDKTKGKRQSAGHLFPEAPTCKDTSNTTPSASFQGQFRGLLCRIEKKPAAEIRIKHWKVREITLIEVSAKVKTKRQRSAGKFGPSSWPSSSQTVEQYHMAAPTIKKIIDPQPFQNEHTHEGSHSPILSQEKVYNN